MGKKNIYSFFANLIVFGSALLFSNKLSLLFFIVSIYLLPMIINALIYVSNKQINKRWVLPSITVAFYFAFSYIFMQQSSFMGFVVSNTLETDGLSIQIQDNLLSVGQLIFVFVINYGIIYLSSKLVGKKSYVTS